MRLVVVCLVCLLAACGPAVVYITPAPVATGDGVLLPEQAQRVIDAYTATARVMATQAALATGTEQSARSTSTAVRAATLDALEGRQTDVALSLTQGAGQAAATDAASIKTQSVQQTRAWSTPTAAALALAVRASTTAIAYQQAQAQADDARNQTVANARDWLLLAVGILFLIGLAAAAVFGVSDLLSARAELLRAAAERATAESRQLWIMQYAGFLLQLRADGWEVMGAPQIMSADIPASGPSLVREAPIKTRG